MGIEEDFREMGRWQCFVDWYDPAAPCHYQNHIPGCPIPEDRPGNAVRDVSCDCRQWIELEEKNLAITLNTRYASDHQRYSYWTKRVDDWKSKYKTEEFRHYKRNPHRSGFCEKCGEKSEFRLDKDYFMCSDCGVRYIRDNDRIPRCFNYDYTTERLLGFNE